MNESAETESAETPKLRVNLIVSRQLWGDLLKASAMTGRSRADFVRLVLEMSCRRYVTNPAPPPDIPRQAG